MNGALEHFTQDLALARAADNKDGISRSLGSLGRVYARQSMFKKAIDAWEEKASFPFTPVEGAWLFHEVCSPPARARGSPPQIGRSYLEQGNNDAALKNGERSKAEAQGGKDSRWTLNALLLIAQAHRPLPCPAAPAPYIPQANWGTLFRRPQHSRRARRWLCSLRTAPPRWPRPHRRAAHRPQSAIDKAIDELSDKVVHAVSFHADATAAS